MTFLILDKSLIYVIFLDKDFEPQNQPQTNSQDTSNLINSEEVAQPQETKVAPPSYS